MTGSDQKFWIGIASAFVLPTMMYIYTQGMTAQSITELTHSVDKFQNNMDNVNDHINVISNTTLNNNTSIENLNKHIDQLDTIANQNQNRLVILETRQGIR